MLPDFVKFGLLMKMVINKGYHQCGQNTILEIDTESNNQYWLHAHESSAGKTGPFTNDTCNVINGYTTKLVF